MHKLFVIIEETKKCLWRMIKMGVSQRAANDKIKKRMFNSSLSTKRENLPDSVTRDEVKCSACGFKARYQFLRCPECNELQTTS